MAAIIPIRWSPNVFTLAPWRGLSPLMIIPSSVGVISAPMLFSVSATTWIRSVSFTFSSSASRMTVCPLAWVAKSAMMGNSSIKRGIISPLISMPTNSDVSTVIVADLAILSTSATLNFPPIAWMTSKMPVRVSLIPTFFKIILEFGTISPATNQKAALEISPGITTFWPINSCPPWIRISLSLIKIWPPNCSIISSVWLRVISFSKMTDSPWACKAANIKADLTWAEATGNV